MRGLNKVCLIGNLGHDPVSKNLTRGKLVAKMSIATSSVFVCRNGRAKTETHGHTIIFWDKLASLAMAYLRKGMLVFVDGEIRSRQYEDKQGIKRSVTEITGTKMIMLDKSENTRDEIS